MDATAVVAFGRRTFLDAMPGGVGFRDHDAPVARMGADFVAATVGQAEVFVDLGDRIELG